MNEDHTLTDIKEWMDRMNVHIPADDLLRIMSNKKTMTVLTVLASHAHPKEEIKKGKHMLLYRKVIMQSGQKNSSKESIKELELVNKRRKLKEQIKQREEDFAEKKKKYEKLMNENEKLLQEIQWTSSVLNEEKKKVFFLMLNEKGLHDAEKSYSSLRHSVNDIKEMLNGKTEKQYSLHYLDHVMEAVTDCQEYFMNLRKTMEATQCIAGDYMNNARNTLTADKKLEMIEYVSERLNGIPLCSVFECVLEQQKHLKNIVQSLPSTPNSDTVEPLSTQVSNCGNIQDDILKILETMFFMPSCANINGSNVVESCPQMVSLKEEQNSRKSTSHSWHSKKDQIVEQLKVVENRLIDVDKRIEEKAKECKKLKINLKTNLDGAAQRILWIKRYFSKLQSSEASGRESDLSVLLDDLNQSMQQFCELGPKEIQLFAGMPLVALEKLTLTDGNIVPAYERMVNYLKVMSSDPKRSAATMFVMKECPGLTPHYLLQHVWKQLSYLFMLQKIYNSVKSFSKSSLNVNLNLDFPSAERKEIDLIKNHFLGILSNFEAEVNDFVELLDIMRTHPFNILAREIPVDGIPLQYYLNMFDQAKPNEDSSCNMNEEQF